MDLCYCKDCRELCYSPVTDKGVFEPRNAAFNHYGHHIVRLNHPENYPFVIRRILGRLQSGAVLKDWEITMFALWIAMDGPEIKNNEQNSNEKTDGEQNS